MRRILRSALPAIAIAFPGLAAAHPGHGIDPSGTSLWHYVANPEHVLPLLAAIAAAVLFSGLGTRRRDRS